MVLRCRFCDDGDVEHAFAVRDRNRRTTDLVFTYVRCRRCGTFSLADPPADLAPYYGGDYFARDAAEDLDRASGYERWRYDEFVAPLVAPGPAIEIGAGDGHFAHLLKRHGFTVTAIEPDAGAARHLREVVGVDAIHTADVAACAPSLPQARVIALWHSLEHSPAAGALIDVLAPKLLPGGILVIAVPNMDSLGFRLLGARWPHVDAPRHITLPPPRTLLARVERAGLAIETTRTDDPGARYFNRFAWEHGLRPLRLPHPARRRAAAGLTRLLRAPETARGSTFTLVARRVAR